MNSLLAFVFPEMVLAVAAILVLALSVTRSRASLAGPLSLAAVVIAVACLPLTASFSGPLLGGMLAGDSLGYVVKTLVLTSVFLVVVLAMSGVCLKEGSEAEFYFFILTAAVALCLGISSANLLMVYLTVETLSVVSYILAGYLHREERSAEAGVKYFLFGALATGLMLYGISLVYVTCGTLELSGIGREMAEGSVDALVLSAAGLLIFAGFAFKAGIVPFHMWVGDVYEGAPWPAAAFFSVAPKVLAIVLLARMFVIDRYFAVPSLEWSVMAAGALTMLAGNLAAVHQTNVRRLLAFSSVAHAGYIFSALSLGIVGLKPAFFYLGVYAFMNLGAFAAAAFISPRNPELSAYHGVGLRTPWLAGGFSLLLLSLAGLPPLAGFLAKLYVIGSMVDSGQLWLALLVALNTLLAFFYYLKIIRAMYFEISLEQPPAPRLPFGALLLVTGCVAAVVLIGLWPGLFLECVQRMFPFVD